MQITNFLVRFHRNMQPAKYEEAGAVVEFSGIIDDGENPAQMTANALALAKRQVLAAVGKGSPTTSETAQSEIMGVDEAPEVDASVIVPAKKSRGRPRTKKSLQAEAAEAMADEAQEEAVAALESEAGVRSGPAEEPEITDKELQETANAAAKKHSGKVVKAIMTETFGVQMLRDITVGDRPKFLKALKKLDKE